MIKQLISEKIQVHSFLNVSLGAVFKSWFWPRISQFTDHIQGSQVILILPRHVVAPVVCLGVFCLTFKFVLFVGFSSFSHRKLNVTPCMLFNWLMVNNFIPFKWMLPMMGITLSTSWVARIRKETPKSANITIISLPVEFPEYLGKFSTETPGNKQRKVTILTYTVYSNTVLAKIKTISLVDNWFRGVVDINAVVQRWPRCVLILKHHEN